MGLRGIYEILKKHPKILDKENINYLVNYIKYKNRNVS
jgi:protein SDA1